MSSLYFRRWTRMYLQPAAKYFKLYNVISPGFQHLLHMGNIQNPPPQHPRPLSKKKLKNPDAQLNDKLIKNLFLKYPDLKYQSINRQKYQGDNFNSFTYSHAFITQQKRLIKLGYTITKSFAIVQQKFQQKMKRKLDQTLMSRGLAIGNRARSLLTIYQQQVQYQSRIKMLRTKRQVLKYENQLKQIQAAISQPLETTQQPQQNPQHPLPQQKQQQPQNFQRILHKITKDTKQQINKQYKNQKRSDMIARHQQQFGNLFKQFYQIAAYRDRLRGLTDDQIKQQIMTSPTKIKKHTSQLVKFLKSKGDIMVSLNGQLKMSQTINDKLKIFISSSPTIRIAILNHLLGYQSPHFSLIKKLQHQSMQKLKQVKKQQIQLSQQTKIAIKQKRTKQYQQAIGRQLFEDVRAYKILQSNQQRMQRLQIIYLSTFIKNSKLPPQQVFQQLKILVQKFRRLKFRVDKRHLDLTHTDLAFPQHYVYDSKPDKIQDPVAEYEDLIQYLRKKVQDRRLRAMDQANDNTINQLIKKQPIDQVPEAQGQDNKPN